VNMEHGHIVTRRLPVYVCTGEYVRVSKSVNQWVSE
jgi:hypothetical protein